MSRFQFHALFAGATALALVTAPAGYAQQTHQQIQGQEDQVQQQGQAQDTRALIVERIEAAEQSLEAGNATDARDALQEASDALDEAMAGQDQPDETMQRLADNLRLALSAADTDDVTGASEALEDARTALQEAEDAGQFAAADQQQTGGVEQDQAVAGQAGQGEDEPEPQASAPGRQPVPALDAADVQVNQDHQVGQQSTAGEQQEPAAGDQQEQQATTQAQQEQQGETELEVTVTEGAAATTAAQPSTSGGQQPGAEDRTAAEATVTETESEAVVVEERQAGAEVQQEGEADGEFKAAVVPGDQLTIQETNEVLSATGEPIGEPAEIVEVGPVDLEGRNVVTFEGEEIGEVDSLVMSGGEVHAIVAHGGFLGIGQNRVAVPMQRLGMRGEDVVLLGLTEEQIDALPEFDFETGQALPESELLQVGRYE